VDETGKSMKTGELAVLKRMVVEKSRLHSLTFETEVFERER